MQRDKSHSKVSGRYDIHVHVIVSGESLHVSS